MLTAAEVGKNRAFKEELLQLILSDENMVGFLYYFHNLRIPMLFPTQRNSSVRSVMACYEARTIRFGHFRRLSETKKIVLMKCLRGKTKQPSTENSQLSNILRTITVPPSSDCNLDAMKGLSRCNDPTGIAILAGKVDGEH